MSLQEILRLFREIAQQAKLHWLIQTYGRYKDESGIQLTSDVPCVAFSGDTSMWKAILKAYTNSIVFFDEDYAFIFSKDFASEIKNTSNYYVLTTAQPLKNLPYSINEIYGIRTTGKYHFPQKVYHEFYPLFQQYEPCREDKILMLVEDEKAGYQFFSKACPNVECKTANGNSNVAEYLSKVPVNQPVVVVADGAAFGAYIGAVTAVARTKKEVSLYFPESFEWLILKSGILEIKNLDEILSNPEKYIDSESYFSWERYFTELLETETREDRIKKYSKSELNSYYLGDKNVSAILKVMPEELVKVLRNE